MKNQHKYGLIGYPISHSFSENYFANKFKEMGLVDHAYGLYPLPEIDQIIGLWEATKFEGMNVTIPYKTQVIPFLDGLSDAAKEIGAVNTIAFRDGQKIGFNTDVIGFENSLIPLLKEHHSGALILGTGGASKAVRYVCEKLGVQVQMVSRNSGPKHLSYQEISPAILRKHKLIINTTPLGMYPNVATFPDLPYWEMTDDFLVYDLVYNPEETAFLKKCKNRGATTKNGLEMLYLQAEASWSIWKEED